MEPAFSRKQRCSLTGMVSGDSDKYKGCDKRVTQHGHLAGSFSLGSGLRDRGLVQVYCKVLLEEEEHKAW